MTMLDDERGENRNTVRPLEEGAEEALNRAERLAFEAKKRVNPEDLQAIRDQVHSALAALHASDQEEKESLRKQLRKLEAQEERLIDLAADGTLNVEKLRQRLQDVTLRKGAIAEKLARTAERIQHGVEKAFAYVDLLEEPDQLYQSVPDSVRRDLLGASFQRLLVRVSDGNLEAIPERTEVNATSQLALAAPPGRRFSQATRIEKSLPRSRGRLSFGASQVYSVQRFE